VTEEDRKITESLQKLIHPLYIHIRIFSQQTTIHTKVKKFLANKNNNYSESETDTLSLEIDSPSHQKIQKNYFEIPVDIIRGKLYEVYSNQTNDNQINLIQEYLKSQTLQLLFTKDLNGN
jgi:hypothetical protein